MATESPHPTADRRQARRYRLALPVRLGDGKGQTRDISTSGAFLEVDTDRTFSPGESVSFTLQSEQVDPGDPVRLQCQGVVLRVEPHEEMVGIAVCFTSFQFETEGQSSPVESVGIRDRQRGGGTLKQMDAMLHQPANGPEGDWVLNFAVNRCRGAIVAVRGSDEFLPHVALCQGGREHYGGEGEHKGKRKRGAMSC